MNSKPIAGTFGAYGIDRAYSFDWRPWTWADGSRRLFPTKKAAEEYWYDGVPGANDRYRVVKVEP